MADVIGRGWAFPVRLSPTGGIALSGGDQEVAEAIRLVLGTARGERPVRPEFGCRIHDLVFDPTDASLLGRIESEVRESLVRWEPRIDLVSVQAEPGPEDPAVVLIHVRYLLRDTDDERSLVFPFYSLPEE